MAPLDVGAQYEHKLAIVVAAAGRYELRVTARGEAFERAQVRDDKDASFADPVVWASSTCILVT